MLYAYLVGAIVGGVLLVASLVMGGSHEAGHTLGDHGGHDADSPASTLFSVRLWTYFLAFGGATGLVLRTLVKTGEPLAAILAGGVGLTAGGVAQAVMKRMSGQLGGTIREGELVGRVGRLLLPVGKTAAGKVRLVVANHAVDLIATTTDEGELAAREEVLVVEVKDGAAVVTRSPLPPSQREGQS
jgi:hypothetical protein